MANHARQETRSPQPTATGEADPTPSPPPHTLGADELGPFLAAEGKPEGLPNYWHPFGPPDLGAWVGPNAAVALAPAGKALRLCASDTARALLIKHAFRSTPALQRAAGSIPPDTPLANMESAAREALPGYVPVEANPGTTLHLVRMAEPVIRFHGKYDTAEWWDIIEGEKALNIVLQQAPKALWTTPRDHLTVALDAPEGKRVLRVIVYAFAVLLLSPIIAAPLLLLDAVLWIIAIGFVWIAAIFAAQRVLTWWENRHPRPLLRLDPWRVWLPGALGGQVLDRRQIEVWMDWIKPFGSYSSGQGGISGASVRNPARTCLHLKTPGLHVQLSHIHEPPAGANLPLMEKGIMPDVLLGMPRNSLWKLAAALAPELRRTRAGRRLLNDKTTGDV